jgi:hypothetical protein
MIELHVVNFFTTSEEVAKMVSKQDNADRRIIGGFLSLLFGSFIVAGMIIIMSAGV